ncbi:MAG: GTPase, partial [Methanothrix sp.]
ITVGVDKIRISLSRLRWASRQTRLITREYVGKIRRARGTDSTPLRKSAFGRFSSVMRSIEKDMLFLNSARNLLRKMPTIDPETPAILIAGYPNVGKSSFIIRITGAKPEVASYPFTTRRIIVGHFVRDDKKYQVVDTPGLLDRPMSERNEIERQTVAAHNPLQGVVLYILDQASTAAILWIHSFVWPRTYPIGSSCLCWLWPIRLISRDTVIWQRCPLRLEKASL